MAIFLYPIISIFSSIKIIRPFAGIFKIVNIITKLLKPDTVLNIIPAYSCKRIMLGNQTGYDDSHNLIISNCFFSERINFIIQPFGMVIINYINDFSFLQVNNEVTM